MPVICVRMVEAGPDVARFAAGQAVVQDQANSIDRQRAQQVVRQPARVRRRDVHNRYAPALPRGLREGRREADRRSGIGDGAGPRLAHPPAHQQAAGGEPRRERAVGGGTVQCNGGGALPGGLPGDLHRTEPADERNGCSDRPHHERALGAVVAADGVSATCVIAVLFLLFLLLCNGTRLLKRSACAGRYRLAHR